MKGGRVPYSADEMAWLEANRTLVISDYHRAFQEAFGRTDVTAANLHGLRKRKGWKVGRAKGRTAGRRRAYSEAEIAWLSANRALPIAEYHSAFCVAFGRIDVSAEKLHALRKREGWKTGRTGQFAPGQVSHNKGKTCPEGVGGRHPNARKTQFQKGHARSGVAVDLYKPIGTEFVRDGYLVRKVNDDMPLQARWRAVHLINWEAAHGPIPADHCLKCVSGDRANPDPSNWEMIPRGLLPRLNGGRASRRPAYDQVEPELRPAVMAAARIEHRIREIRRKARA